MSSISVVPSLQMVTTVGATSDKNLTLSGTNAHSGVNTFSGANSFTNTNTYSGSGSVIFNDNLGCTFGTGSDSRIYYDGTDLIVDPDIVGSGEVLIGSAGDSNLIANKVAFASSAISANFIVNVQTSGNARGAMQFDYTATGTNPLTDLLLKATSQHTNASPTSTCTTQTMIKDDNPSGNSSYINTQAQFGTVNTRTITQGTMTFSGIDISGNQGTGTANTGGTIRQFGIRINTIAGYTGVASDTIWGINSQHDIQCNNDVALILGGTNVIKGTNGFVWLSSGSKISTQVGGNEILGMTSTTGTFADAYNIAVGTTTGTKIGTSTSQKLGFFNSTPVAQVAATTDLGTVLSNLGFRAAGTAYPITTSGAVNLTGGVTVATVGLTITDVNVILGTTTGTKFGTATTQKLSFYNSTPIVQPSSTGETTGFTAGGGTTVTDASTFTGNVGATAYRISDIVKHLKNLGLIAA